MLLPGIFLDLFKRLNSLYAMDNNVIFKKQKTN